MIKINFIPEHLRKEEAGFLGGGLARLPQEVLWGTAFAVMMFFLVIHVALAFVLVGGFFKQMLLEKRWATMSLDKKNVDDIVKEATDIQVRMASLAPITSGRVLPWGKTLNDISDSLPKGVWIQSINFDKTYLTISGSAVSKSMNEMMLPGVFTASLKEKRLFKDHFITLDVDSIQRRANTALSIADFSLKGKIR
jgi:hypothetical protein